MRPASTPVRSRHRIRRATQRDWDTVVDIWRAASEVGHPFLSEEDLDGQERLVRTRYLPGSDLWVAEDTGGPAGFMGLLGHYIGALFVAPDRMGGGVGRALLEHAQARHDRLTVGVYEANAAVGFYRRCGFEPMSRSETDDEGRPLPVVTLAWTRS